MEMNFFLTFYIYPLKEKIILSKSHKFHLDNPRTSEEIATVENYLVRAYESGYDLRLPVQSDEDIVTIEDILFKVRDKLSKEDEYVSKFFESYERERVFEFIARMWIIARFDDEGENERIRKRYEEIIEAEPDWMGFFLIEDDNPIMVNSERLSNYSCLLSLLCHSDRDEYFGKSLLLDPELLDPMRPPSQSVWQTFMMFYFFVYRHPDYRPEETGQWWYLPYAITEIRRVSTMLEDAFAEGLDEKLLYIGSILRIAGHETRDPKVKILLLTSIIELLLTHSPDFHRYNVEDSISKQFQLKASTIVYLNDRTRDLDYIKERLKIIYQQHSNIAHGNLEALDRYVSGLSKREGEEEYLEDLAVDLYTYIRAILEEYLKDRVFVEALKKG